MYTHSQHVLNWYNPQKTAILWEAHQLVDWSTFYDHIEDLYTLMDTVNHPVDIIYVMRDREFKVPHSLIPNMRKIVTRMHPNERWKIIVGSSCYVQDLFHIACQKYPELAAEWVFVNTLEDADSFLSAADNAVQLPYYPTTRWN